MSPDSPAAAVQIEYYTDPLCSWSWALEPAWRRLRYEFGDRLAYRYRMAGMIPDWGHFADPMNAVHAPRQMAPHWYMVRQMSGMPLDERIWLEDPPASSYPACLAFKAAELQGAGAAERYLRRLREAVMRERRNIARRDVLLELAGELAARPGEVFDVDRFTANLDGEEAAAAFREDMKEARYRGIGRFPTLVFRRPDGRGTIIVGYRPYGALRAALGAAAPGIEPVRRIGSAEEYAAAWEGLTERELAEAVNESADPLPVGPG